MFVAQNPNRLDRAALAAAVFNQPSLAIPPKLPRVSSRAEALKSPQRDPLTTAEIHAMLDEEFGPKQSTHSALPGSKPPTSFKVKRDVNECQIRPETVLVVDKPPRRVVSQMALRMSPTLNKQEQMTLKTQERNKVLLEFNSPPRSAHILQQKPLMPLMRRFKPNSSAVFEQLPKQEPNQMGFTIHYKSQQTQQRVQARQSAARRSAKQSINSNQKQEETVIHQLDTRTKAIQLKIDAKLATITRDYTSTLKKTAKQNEQKRTQLYAQIADLQEQVLSKTCSKQIDPTGAKLQRLQSVQMLQMEFGKAIMALKVYEPALEEVSETQSFHSVQKSRIVCFPCGCTVEKQQETCGNCGKPVAKAARIPGEDAMEAVAEVAVDVAEAWEGLVGMLAGM